MITQNLICSTFSVSFIPVAIKRMQMATLLQQRITILVELIQFLIMAHLNNVPAP
jgi:hypothetical protein